MATRAARLLKAIDHYRKHLDTWDTLRVFPKVKILSAGDGCMSGEFTVTEDICNVAETLHGGFTSSVIDVFSIYASLQHPKGVLSWTTDMNIMYLGLGKKGDLIRVDVKPLNISKSRMIMECSLMNKTSGFDVARGTVNLVPAHKVDVTKNLPYDWRSDE